MAIAMPRCSLFQISAMAPDMILSRQIYSNLYCSFYAYLTHANGAELKNPPNARPTKIMVVFLAVATRICVNAKIA